MNDIEECTKPLDYLIELLESRSNVKALPEYKEWKGTATINAMTECDRLSTLILKEVERLYDSGELQEVSGTLAKE